MSNVVSLVCTYASKTYSMLIVRLLWAGKNVLFVSNNASKSRPMYKKTFDDFGIDTTDVSPASHSGVPEGPPTNTESYFTVCERA